MQQEVTLTLTRYAEPDALVRRSLAAALSQEGVTGEVLFVEQQVHSSISANDFPDAKLDLRIIRGELRGLSQARNVGLDNAKHSNVMFLDTDAIAAANFAKQLASALEDPKVAVAGARIVPSWPGAPPLLARARAVYDQYSLLDLGMETKPYHRVVGAGFGADMAKLPDDFRFDEELGRREGLLFGGEESDFCNRARSLGFQSLYVGEAQATHLIEPERTKLDWILKRLIYAGQGRAQLGGSPAPGGKARLADWLLLPVYLPPYALGWIWGKLAR